MLRSIQAKNPSRDLPIAILGSLSVATILYVLMALAITMMVRALHTALSPLRSALALHCFSDIRVTGPCPVRWQGLLRRCQNEVRLSSLSVLIDRGSAL